MRQSQLARLRSRRPGAHPRSRQPPAGPPTPPQTPVWTLAPARRPGARV